MNHTISSPTISSSESSGTVLGEFLAFLERLREEHIHHRVGNYNPDRITVEIAVPGERWEVEFLSSGETEIEIFKSDGEILSDSSFLESLFTRHGTKA